VPEGCMGGCSALGAGGPWHLGSSVAIAAQQGSSVRAGRPRGGWPGGFGGAVAAPGGADSGALAAAGLLFIRRDGARAAWGAVCTEGGRVPESATAACMPHASWCRSRTCRAALALLERPEALPVEHAEDAALAPLRSRGSSRWSLTCAPGRACIGCMFALQQLPSEATAGACQLTAATDVRNCDRRRRRVVL
jgi:hypothetical protein